MGKISLLYENIIAAGDFKNHIERVCSELKILLDITESYGYKRLSKEPTHKDGGCTDLVFLLTHTYLTMILSK